MIMQLNLINMVIANLLKDYNFIENIKKYIFCKNYDLEVKQLQKYRYDFEIIIYLLLYLSLITIFAVRIFWSSNYKNLKSSYMFLRLGLFCLGLNSFLLFISFIFIIYFKCVISFRQHIKKKK